MPKGYLSLELYLSYCIWTFGWFGETGTQLPNHRKAHNIWLKVFNFKFWIHREVANTELYFSYSICGIWAIWRNWAAVLKIMGKHKCEPKFSTLKFCVQWEFTDPWRLSEYGVIPVLQYLGHLGNLGKLGCSFLNHGKNTHYLIWSLNSNFYI